MDGSAQDTLPRVAGALVRTLGLAGIRAVFGVPGGPIMGLFDALDRSPIEVVLCKSELGATFAADGYARVSGLPGVAVVTSGPGVTNSLTGLAVANADRVPLVLLSGQVSTSAFGRGAVQDGSPLGTDVVAMSRPATARAIGIGSPAQAQRVLPLALALARARRRPVHVSLPADVLGAPAVADEEIVGGLVDEEPVDDAAVPSPSAIARAARLLRNASRVAVLAGGGLGEPRARALLCELAERLGAQVATTQRGKGAIDERHPLALGVLGFGGSSLAEQVLLQGELDVLLVLCSSLGEFGTHNWDRRLGRAKMIHIDTDRAQIGVNYPALPLVGDAGLVLEALLAELRGIDARDRVAPAWAPEPAAVAELAPDDPVLAFRQVQTVLDELPHAILACDIGNSTALAAHHLRLKPTQTFLLNLGFACMGHTVPAAIGARFAAPDRPVIGLIGDGAFAMTGLEVHTAVESQPGNPRFGGPVYAVLNNSGHGTVHIAGSRQYPRMNPRFAMYARRIDVAGVAEACGAHFERLQAGELAPALRRALAPGRGPTVLDVQIDPEAVPPIGCRLESMLRSAAGTLG